MPKLFWLFTIWLNVCFHLDSMSLSSMHVWPTCTESLAVPLCICLYTCDSLSLEHISLSISKFLLLCFPTPPCPHLRSSLTYPCVSDTVFYLSSLDHTLVTWITTSPTPSTPWSVVFCFFLLEKSQLRENNTIHFFLLLSQGIECY